VHGTVPYANALDGIPDSDLRWRRQCEHCPHRGIKDYYLVALLDRNSGNVSWVELTEGAALDLLNQLRELEHEFYGAVVRIARERKTMKAPITVSIDINSKVHGRLRAPMEPSETLERVFNSPKSSSKARLKAV